MGNEQKPPLSFAVFYQIIKKYSNAYMNQDTFIRCVLGNPNVNMDKSSANKYATGTRDLTKDIREHTASLLDDNLHQIFEDLKLDIQSIIEHFSYLLQNDDFDLTESEKQSLLGLLSPDMSYSQKLILIYRSATSCKKKYLINDHKGILQNLTNISNNTNVDTAKYDSSISNYETSTTDHIYKKCKDNRSNYALYYQSLHDYLVGMDPNAKKVFCLIALYTYQMMNSDSYMPCTEITPKQKKSDDSSEIFCAIKDEYCHRVWFSSSNLLDLYKDIFSARLEVSNDYENDFDIELLEILYNETESQINYFLQEEDYDFPLYRNSNVIEGTTLYSLSCPKLLPLLISQEEAEAILRVLECNNLKD